MAKEKLTISKFREHFPEFTEGLYPDTAVQIRLNLANAFFNPEVWADDIVREHAICLYVAHFLKMVGSSSSGGNGIDGNALGVVNSKSVDGASVSFDVSQGSNADAGLYNTTAYGRELWDLMYLFGAGGVQL